MKYGIVDACLLLGLHILLAVASLAAPAADPTARFHLANAQYDFTFTSTGLLSVVNRKTGVTVSAAEMPYAPVSLTIERNGKKEDLALESLPTQVRLIGAPAPTAVEYAWGTPETVQLVLRIETVANEPELTRWRVTSLTVGTGVKVASVRLPVLRNVRIGEEQVDDWFVAPAYAYHGAGVWYNTQKAIPSPMDAAINWASVFDRASGSGLSFFLDDTNDLDVAVLAAKDAGGLHTGFTFACSPTQLPEAYVAVHAGDWHQVADHFRTTVGGREPAPKNPAWAKDLDAWQTVAINEKGSAFNILPSFYRAVAQPSGARLLNIYSASCDGAWVYCGVYPYPNPYYGTEEELRDAVMRVRDLGGRTIFYINYQLTIPFGPSVKKIGPVPVAMIPQDVPMPFQPPGQPPVTNRSTVGYASDEFGVNRKLRAWSDRNLYWALRYAKNYGADGIYWDQLSCSAGGLKETAWNLARITEECRKIVPNFIAGGEGVGMAHGRNLTLGLASAVFHRTELYRYTFPAHLVIDGTANGANTWGDARYANERFNVVFLDGCRFDGMPPDNTFARNTIALRQRTKQLLYQATFRDTEGVSLTVPYMPTDGCVHGATDGVQAKRYVLNTPSSKLILVNTVNNSGKPETGTKDTNGKFSTPPDYARDQSLYQKGVIATVETGDVGPIRQAWVFLWGGAVQPIAFQQVSKTAASFEVPATMQATVVLVNRCEPLLYPELPVMTVAGASVQAKIEVLNLDPSPISGTATWATPVGWHGSPVAFGPLKPGETAALVDTVTTGAQATRQPYDLYCLARTTDNRMGRRYASLSVVPSPYAYWEFTPDGDLSVTLRELTGKAVTATVALVAPKESGLNEPNQTQTVTVPAGGETQVVCRLSGREQQEAACVMQLAVTAAGVTQSMPVRLTPYLANGGFESTAGDDQPDFWAPKDYSGKVDLGEQIPLVSLDDNIAYTGKHSLRIDPYMGKVKDFKGITVFPESFKLLYNRTYRVTGYLRIPKADPANAGNPDGQGVIFAGQEYIPMSPVGQPDANGWQKYERTFTTNNPDWSFVLVLQNTGKTPVWFDAISVTEVTK
ncbi:MAG: hypothetical protein ACYDBB_02880 [Armatimonadota bacterium]